MTNERNELVERPETDAMRISHPFANRDTAHNVCDAAVRRKSGLRVTTKRPALPARPQTHARRKAGSRHFREQRQTHPLELRVQFVDLFGGLGHLSGPAHRLDLGAHLVQFVRAEVRARALDAVDGAHEILLLTGGARGVHVGEPRGRVREEEFDHFLEEPIVAFALEALEGFEAVPVQHRGFRRGRGTVFVGLNGHGGDGGAQLAALF